MSATLEAHEPSARYLDAAQPALLRQFDLSATAPGGVARLWDLIRALAVQGKLVTQDPRDEHASLLLRRIERERVRLAGEGQIRKARAASVLAEGEQPFDAPVGWVWARLDQLSPVGLSDGDWIESKDQDPNGEVRLIQLADVGDGNFKDKSSRFVSASTCTALKCTLLRPADILIARLPSPIGRACVFPGVGQEAITAVDVAICRLGSDLLPAFVALAINAPLSRQIIESYGKGATRFRVSTGHLKTLPIAVPPLAEQVRIVTRVDELMRLCDALEAKGRLETEQHARLLDTLLSALTDSSTPEELAANWQRVADHFDLLLDRPEAVDALEQTILQLAVRGLLVPQDSSDEPAGDFLQRLRSERLRLSTERRGNRDERWSPIEDGPHELPSSWTWTTIEAIADVGTGTTPSRDNAAFFAGGTIPWVTSGETGQPFIRNTAQHVTEAALVQTSLTVYPVGTLIVAMYGQGKTRGQVSELCLAAATNQACAAIVLMEQSAAHRSFIKVVFEKSYDEIRELSAGGAQPNLNVGKVKASQIPLPPLAEQARIVGRVTELRRLCADLRQRLAASRTTQSDLADALVADVA